MKSKGCSYSSKKEILSGKLHSRHEKIALLCGLIQAGGCTPYKDDEYEILQGIAKKLTADCENVPDEILKDESSVCCYLKGLYLAAGSVSIKQGYHLELAIANSLLADGVAELFRKREFHSKIIFRKDKFIVYFKGVDNVSDVLAYLGANKAVLELNSTYADRQVNQSTNRLLNCDLANIDKSIAAAKIQIDAIESLILSGELENFDEKLYETAMLRLENPYMSIDELSKIQGITKSGMSHRLKKIVEKAK